MAVDRELIALLVCPACHGDIEYKERRKLIICTQCGLHYPVRDDIPVMLVEEATRPEQRGDSRGPEAAGAAGQEPTTDL
ncbi:MAG: Trm112 family protein [Actinomycetota bacterium]|nr:Trm112 family protein [Actinomycetota bacterium]